MRIGRLEINFIWHKKNIVKRPLFLTFKIKRWIEEAKANETAVDGYVLSWKLSVVKKVRDAFVPHIGLIEAKKLVDLVESKMLEKI